MAGGSSGRQLYLGSNIAHVLDRLGDEGEGSCHHRALGGGGGGGTAHTAHTSGSTGLSQWTNYSEILSVG